MEGDGSAWALGLIGNGLSSSKWGMEGIDDSNHGNWTPTSRILNGRRITANSEQHVRARRPDADIARKVVQRVRVRGVEAIREIAALRDGARRA
jgi:hypothetical protein